MKQGERPIPLRSVLVLPRWLMLGGVLLSAACILFGVGCVVYGLGFAAGAGRWGWVLGGGLGGIGGGAGGLYGTLNDWHRRLPAPMVFGYLQRCEPSKFYRRAFWPSLFVLAVGLALVFSFGWLVGSGFVQAGFIVGFLAGSQEAVRRHLHRSATAVFALYADGVLDPLDAAAIDSARRTDARFDAAVRDYQRVMAVVQLPSPASDHVP